MLTFRPSKTCDWKTLSLGNLRPSTAKDPGIIHSSVKYQALIKSTSKNKSCSMSPSLYKTPHLSLSPRSIHQNTKKIQSLAENSKKLALMFSKPPLDPLQSLCVRSLKMKTPCYPKIAKSTESMKYTSSDNIKNESRNSKRLHDYLKNKEEFKMKTNSINFEKSDSNKELKINRLKRIIKNGGVMKPLRTVDEKKMQELAKSKSPLTIQRLNKFLYISN